MMPRPLAALLLLAACAAEPGGYPSLAPRPIEKIDVAAEPAEPTPVPNTDPAVTARAGAALAAAEKADQGFAAAADAAEPRIRAAAGAAEGSDRWVEAQLALSRVQSARLPTADALQALDDQRAAIGDGPADPVLEAARARAAAILAAEDERISRLEALLGPR